MRGEDDILAIGELFLAMNYPINLHETCHDI